jgi:hypothetical protein
MSPGFRFSAIFTALLAAPGLTACQGTSSPAAGIPISQSAASRTGAVSRSYTPPCPCLYVANNLASASLGSITIYPLSANGNYSPGSNVIAGSSTNLDHPFDVAVGRNGKIYVANPSNSSITVYAADSSGNATPLQTIIGSSTGLNGTSGIAVSDNGDIYATNGLYGGTASVTVFSPTANGNATPIRTIAGSNTGLVAPLGIAVSYNKIFVGNRSSIYYTIPGSVTVYPVKANGNVTPVQAIGGPNTGIGDEALYVAWYGRKIYVTSALYQIGIFPDSANGNVAPTKSISGGATLLNNPQGVAIAAQGKIFVTNVSGGYAVTSYKKFGQLAVGNNNIPPLTDITGSNTGLDEPYGLAVH